MATIKQIRTPFNLAYTGLIEGWTITATTDLIQRNWGCSQVDASNAVHRALNLLEQEGKR